MSCFINCGERRGREGGREGGREFILQCFSLLNYALNITMLQIFFFLTMKVMVME